MRRMERPEGFITTSLDRHVKVWSRSGELWGDIVTFGENPVACWQFPYDWSEEKEREKSQVVAMMEKIEPNSKYAEARIEYKDSRKIKIRLSSNNDWDKIVPKRTFAKRIYDNFIARKNKEIKEKLQKRYEKLRVSVKNNLIRKLLNQLKSALKLQSPL